MYDAVNRADKTPVSPAGSISRPIGFYLPNTSEQADEEPPPLPPRITPTEDDLGAKGFSFDSRRRSTKLYQDVVQRRMYEKELVEFYEMVKDLRGNQKSFSSKNKNFFVFQPHTNSTMSQQMWVT